jgi:hypothetical protein
VSARNRLLRRGVEPPHRSYASPTAGHLGSQQSWRKPAEPEPAPRAQPRSSTGLGGGLPHHRHGLGDEPARRARGRLASGRRSSGFPRDRLTVTRGPAPSLMEAWHGSPSSRAPDLGRDLDDDAVLLRRRPPSSRCVSHVGGR